MHQGAQLSAITDDVRGRCGFGETASLAQLAHGLKAPHPTPLKILQSWVLPLAHPAQD